MIGSNCGTGRVRAVALLAADLQVIQKSVRMLGMGDLAREYGFADIDGRLPPSFRIDGGLKAKVIAIQDGSNSSCMRFSLGFNSGISLFDYIPDEFQV